LAQGLPFEIWGRISLIGAPLDASGGCAGPIRGFDTVYALKNLRQVYRRRKELSMPVVIAAASTNSPQFAVVEFTNVPARTVMVSASSVGNVVDCYGKLAVAGDFAGGTVTLFDIGDPTAPTRLGSVDTGLASVTAISIDGSHVLAGGATRESEAQLVLVSISNAASPSVVSVFSDTGTANISGVVIRGAHAVAFGTDEYLVMDYKKPASPSGAGYPTGASQRDLTGRMFGDFNGTNAVVTSEPNSVTGEFPKIYVLSIAQGAASQLAALPSEGTLSSLAIAEIPQTGGYYVTTAQLGGQFSIQALMMHPSGSSTFPVPHLKESNTAVAVKFLNNPAMAPLLAVANVTTKRGFFITSNFLLPESDGHTTTIQIGKPIPEAHVTLAPTLNPTLGITGWD